jgi:hypothetical protein
MVAGWTSRDVLMLGAALLAVAGAQELLARWKARKSRAKPLLPRLAIIVVTSPAPCHPSTRMLECLLDSFARVQGLLEGGRVPITIVCDGVKVRASDKLKRGMCTPELELRYREYIRALRAIIAKGDRPWCAQVRARAAGARARAVSLWCRQRIRAPPLVHTRASTAYLPTHESRSHFATRRDRARRLLRHSPRRTLSRCPGARDLGTRCGRACCTASRST